LSGTAPVIGSIGDQPGQEDALAEVGWRTIRASIDVTETIGDAVAAPKDLNLGVVGTVMDLITSTVPDACDSVSRWRQSGCWQGRGLYDELVRKAGASAEGASAWRHRRR
jgi:hypothetical protein